MLERKCGVVYHTPDRRIRRDARCAQMAAHITHQLSGFVRGRESNHCERRTGRSQVRLWRIGGLFSEQPSEGGAGVPHRFGVDVVNRLRITRIAKVAAEDPESSVKAALDSVCIRDVQCRCAAGNCIRQPCFYIAGFDIVYGVVEGQVVRRSIAVDVTAPESADEVVRDVEVCGLDRCEAWIDGACTKEITSSVERAKTVVRNQPRFRRVEIVTFRYRVIFKRVLRQCTAEALAGEQNLPLKGGAMSVGQAFEGIGYSITIISPLLTAQIYVGPPILPVKPVCPPKSDDRAVFIVIPKDDRAKSRAAVIKTIDDFPSVDDHLVVRTRPAGNTAACQQLRIEKIDFRIAVQVGAQGTFGNERRSIRIIACDQAQYRPAIQLCAYRHIWLPLFAEI